MKSAVIISFLLHLKQIEFSLGKAGSVERIDPKGFRITSSRYIVDDRITHAVFNVNINRTLENEGPTDFIATITESYGGQWIYDNVNTRVEPDTKIHYRIDVFYNSEDINSTTIKRSYADQAELPGYTIEIAPPIAKRCAELYRLSEKCELSATTVRGQRVCEGKLIFEEHFDELDPKVWKMDARIPSASEDSPFVSFQNDPEILFTHNGWLFIKPKYQWETPGFNESMLKTGSLHITGCSGMEKECSRNGMFSQILPPIISARVRTKHSFSFRYGKVVIGAYMPKGDWTMPLLLLEPLENYYGCSNYASGQIRIASSRGNRVLQTTEGKDISSRYLSGGVVVENRGPLHDVNLRHYDAEERVSDGFHNFTLTWTEESISLGIDGYEYGRIEGGFSKMHAFKNSRAWQSDNLMAPFDREFFFTIGLSVGGHTDFPDGCKSGDDRVMKPWKNNDPKAMLNFWKDRENWMRSWRRYDTKFGVNFILVYAL